MSIPAQKQKIEEVRLMLADSLCPLTAENIVKALRCMALPESAMEPETKNICISRQGHIGNELRQNAAPEYRSLICSKRQPNALQRNVETVRLRHSRSWKDTAKSRKQWLVKIKQKDKKSAAWIRREKRRKQYWASRGDRYLHRKVSFTSLSPLPTQSQDICHLPKPTNGN